MGVRAIRAAVMTASLLAAIGYVAQAQATGVSVGSINRTVNVADQGLSESAAIGRIDLQGQRSNGLGLPGAALHRRVPERLSA